MNSILDCRSLEYTASRAYKIHIVASDHRRKETHIDIASTAAPVVEEFKKVLWDGYGKILLIFWPIRSIAYPDWPVGPRGRKTDRVDVPGGRP